MSRTVERPCAYCGERFSPKAWNVRKGFGRFCSHSCRAQYYGGREEGIPRRTMIADPWDIALGGRR